MSAVKKLHRISVEDYLAEELISPIKHEYLGGVVYALAGARIAHNVVSGNIHGSLHGRLRGRKCRPFNSDTKVRVQLPTHARFYYPDVSVVCHSNPQEESFQDQPVAIFEVLSRATRRTDEGEKRDAYLTIPSLRVYALVEQESASILIDRRSEQGFINEVYEGQDAVIPLAEIDTELPLAEVYGGVAFSPEPPDEAAELR